MAAVPLMLIPFILYNLDMIGLFGSGGIASLHDVRRHLEDVAR
jgi:hypothetical protein